MDQAVRLVLFLLAAAAVWLVFTIIHVIVFRRWVRDAVEVEAAPPAVEAPVRRIELACLALILGAAAAINLPRLTGGLDYDELDTAVRFVVGVPLWTAVAGVRAFNNHVAFSILANLSVRLFGSAEWAIRLPAFLLGLGTIYALWRFARTWTTAWTALLSAGLLAVMPYFAEWTRAARGYTGLAFMTVWSTHAFFLALRDGSKRAARAHTVSTTLAAYFHLYGLWIVLLQYAAFLTVVLRRRGSPNVRGLWRSFEVLPLLVVILYLPQIPSLAAEVVRRQAPFGQPFQATLARDLFNAYTGVDAPVLVAALWVLAALGALSLRKPLMAGYLVALPTLPFLAAWLLLRPYALQIRFFSYGLPGFALLVANGTRAAENWAMARPVGWARAAGATAAALTVAVLAGAWLRADIRPPRPAGYRELLKEFLATPLPNATLGGDSYMFTYYLGRPEREIHSVAELDQFMASAPTVLVGHQYLIFNTPEELEIAARLKARCSNEDRGPMMLYRCSR
jgi:hypothetical protein